MNLSAFACVVLLSSIASGIFAGEAPAGTQGADHIASIGLSEGQTPLVMVRIKAGKFVMGTDGVPKESPAHEVEIGDDYYIGKYEVTQGQFGKFKQVDPGKYGWKGDNMPAQYVSRKDCVNFCEWLNKNDSKKPDGYVYRLPTEAEWEYACRAGSKTLYVCGDDKQGMDEYAWHETNSKGMTHDVGGKKPNAWGLCDMNGNVWEWCQDLYDKYPSSAQKDPKGPEKLLDPKDPSKTLYPVYVLRGGCWFSGMETLRSTLRHNADNDHSGNNVACRVALVKVK